jgi:hypothetical protein
MLKIVCLFIALGVAMITAYAIYVAKMGEPGEDIPLQDVIRNIDTRIESNREWLAANGRKQHIE